MKTEWEYAVFRLVALTLRSLPLPIASGLMGGLWRYIAPHLRRHKRALAHLAMIYPEKSPREREAMARDMWEHLGRTSAEFFHLDTIANEGRITIETVENFEIMQRDGPYIVCAMHLGNWELLAGVSARFARSLAGVYQPLRNDKIDKQVQTIRAPLYPLGLFPRSSASLRKVMSIVKNGGSAGFMADLREGKGAAVPFLGRPAFSNTAPALLARTYGTKLYAAAIIRQPNIRFKLYITPVFIPITENRDTDIVAATANVQAAFAQFLDLAPEQWMWAHRRWD